MTVSERPRQLFVGQEIHSYCGGIFGRDCYGGRIEAFGFDWIVVRDRYGSTYHGTTKGFYGKECGNSIARYLYENGYMDEDNREPEDDE